MTVEPTIFRVGPIAWMIKNKNVFFINIEDSEKKWKKFELIIYFLLKTFVFIVVYLFPTIVLALSLIKADIFNFANDINLILRLLLISLSIISVISFSIVFMNELIFTFRIPRKILKEKSPNT